MKHPINIQVVNKQTLFHGGKDQLEYCGEGHLYKKSNSFYLRYKENNKKGETRASVTIKIDRNDPEVYIKRNGTSSFKQNFKAGESFQDFYYFSGERIELKTLTNELEFNRDDSGGEVYIVYKLFLGGQEIGLNKLVIDYKFK
ncbi:MAG: DUF1934 domain-containing protein [Bacillota bacterium]